MAVSKGKKGIFFTFAAVALSLVIIFSFRVYTDYGLKDQMDPIESRVTTMNSFITSMEKDIENVIFIVGFRSLLSIEDYMMDHDTFLNIGNYPSLDVAFEGSFLNGAIPRGATEDKMPLMDNNTFLNWTQRMEEEANKTDITLDFTINDVTITHSEPWQVDVSVDLTISVKDRKKTASWSIDREFTKQINITGFVDPLYLVNNDGKVNNTIRKTIVPDFNDEDDLDTHLINSYYIEHSDAPSYLMRFENDLGSSSYGIESLVNSEEIEDAGLVPKIRSAVDFVYYGAQVVQICEVEDPSYNWFYLDFNSPYDHLDFYNAECD
ncbi:hypothetical protein HYU09_05105 [Candidatus Woesearchaeota archaeon]|nr:hypothetical protein [Candidatus Woesearchaeota archaeon]